MTICISSNLCNIKQERSRRENEIRNPENKMKRHLILIRIKRVVPAKTRYFSRLCIF